MKKNLKTHSVVWGGLMLPALVIILLSQVILIHGSLSSNSNRLSPHPYPKMEYVLQELIWTSNVQGMDKARRLAEIRGIELIKDKVRVVVVTHPAQEKFVTNMRAQTAGYQMTALGGEVESIYSHQVQGIIPISTLAALVDEPMIARVRLPWRPLPLEVSEGVDVTGASVWQNIAPYRGAGGAGVKVCILDLGFTGYESLLGTELPDNVVVRSFRADGDLLTSEHGTACAEIVHDMAPEAEIYLVNFSTEIEHHEAVDWIIAEGVNIVSYSLGWLCAGAGDGTGPLDEDVYKAHQAGIIWVSAAGNSAQRHWEGSFSDPDKDGWCNFSDSGSTPEYFAFYTDKGEQYSIWLRWDDWGLWNGSDYIGSSGHDYDLSLYNKDRKLLAASKNRQAQGFYPIEGIVYRAKVKGWKYFRIKKWKAARDCRLEIFIQGGYNLEHVVSEGSINVPADSAHAVAVGASDWESDAYHVYSSQGPTTDGRVKPDLCAPAGVSTSTYGRLEFFGTSAAAPHVAGAYALLKAKASFSWDQINQILRDRALDLGTPGPDNLYGRGRLKLNR